MSCTVEPPVSDHPKTGRSLQEVVVYKNRNTGFSSEKRSRHTYLFMEDNFIIARNV